MAWWVVHEKCGPSGNVRWLRLARVGRSFFVLPFLLLLFFGQAKKSKVEWDALYYYLRIVLIRTNEGKQMFKKMLALIE